jgi:hypothetical protein
VGVQDVRELDPPIVHAVRGASCVVCVSCVVCSPARAAVDNCALTTGHRACFVRHFPRRRTCTRTVRRCCAASWSSSPRRSTGEKEKQSLAARHATRMTHNADVRATRCPEPRRRPAST